MLEARSESPRNGERRPLSQVAPNHQPIQQRPRRQRNLVHGAVERLLIRPRRLAIAADFADELERGGVQFFVRGGRVRSPERLDASAHVASPVLAASRAVQLTFLKIERVRLE